MLYHLQQITKSYNGATVLDIPELTLQAGRIYALAGPNGAGKTTLLHILGFLIPPSSGTIDFANLPVRFSDHHLMPLRKRVVLVEQSPILFSNTVGENIGFGLKMRGFAKSDRNGMIESMLELVGMTRFKGADARFLSGGETRRVAIARALACNPEVLLLDEPTADLDPENQVAIERIIRMIHHEKNITIVLCTHNQLQAARLTRDQICLMGGRLTDTVYENRFNGERIYENNRCFYRIAENVLIPADAQDKNKMTRVSISPRSIKFAAPEDAGACPAYDARVIQMTEEGEHIKAIIDVGVFMHMLMTRNEYRNLTVRVGDRVRVCIQPAGITQL